MNIREEILARLRQGQSFGKIRTEVRSVSKLYEVTGQFLDELQTRLEDAQAAVSQAESERAGLEACVANLRREREKYLEEEQTLKQNNVKLHGELTEKTIKLNSLRKRIEELGTRGFTPEIMRELKPLVERGGDTVLKQVTSIRNYRRAMEEFSVLNKKATCLRKEAHALENAKKQAEDAKVSLENQIDELQLQASSIKDAVNTIVWLLNRGYTVEDIRALGYGLEFLGVDGDPDGSISRLVAALRRTKNQMIVEQSVRRRRHELTALGKAAEDTKVEVAIAKEVLLKSINEVWSASIQSIQSANEKANNAMAATCQKLNEQIQVSLDNLRVQSEKKTEWVEEQGRRESEFAQERIRFETEVQYGRFYQAFFASDDFLSKVPVSWILHTSQRLHLWIIMKLPNETIVPPFSFQPQLGLMNLPYSLTTLAELICLGLQKVSSRGSVPSMAER